jgi:hypothetical protein
MEVLPSLGTLVLCEVCCEILSAFAALKHEASILEMKFFQDTTVHNDIGVHFFFGSQISQRAHLSS